jgi:hypothetical protein
MSRYTYTSIPAWAASDGELLVPSEGPVPLDAPARSWLVIGTGAEGRARVDAWSSSSTGVPVRSITGNSAADVRELVAAALAEATVGVRVGVAGPVADCLALRGQLVSAGVEDDELLITPTGAGAIDVFCSHCQRVTSAEAAIGDVVPCQHCGLGLLVYYHVSRRSGSFLGFQADAESPDPEGRSVPA